MIDWSSLLHAYQVGRWEGFVILWNALWTDAQTYWWFGPLVVFILATAGRKKLFRLASKVLGAYVSSHH